MIKTKNNQTEKNKRIKALKDILEIILFTLFLVFAAPACELIVELLCNILWGNYDNSI